MESIIEFPENKAEPEYDQYLYCGNEFKILIGLPYISVPLIIGVSARIDVDHPGDYDFYEDTALYIMLGLDETGVSPIKN